MSKKMMKKVSYSKTQIIGFVLGIAAFLLIYLVLPISGLSKEGKGVLATLALMGVWWICEVANAGIVGLLPLIIFPLTNSLSAASTAAAYGSNTVFMFFGGFGLALALEKWGLHKRIALAILDLIGTSLNRLVIGLMITGAFLSMWVSNIATILMLLPIATAIATTICELVEESTGSKTDEKTIKKLFILAIGFGSIIGGSVTLIGTPTNIALAGFATSLLGVDISFAKFMLFELPIAIVQAVVVGVALTKFLYKVTLPEGNFAKEAIKKQRKELGSMSTAEIRTSIVFIVIVLCWVTQTLLKNLIVNISDTIISIIACVILFMIPSGEEKCPRLLGKDAVKEMPWVTILMLMGGMAVAAGFSGTDLSTWIGNALLGLSGSPKLIVILVVCFISLFVTQFAPNTATSTVLLPITISLAEATGIEPLMLMTVAALGCGFACTVPIGTPVMGVIYGTREFSMSEVIKNGLILAIVSLIMIVIASMAWLPIIY